MRPVKDVVQPYSIEPLTEKEAGPKWRWKRLLVGGLAALILLPLVAWQVVESEWFLRRYVLPKVNDSIHGVIHFDSADWSLGNSLELNGLSLHAEGQPTCLKVKRLQVRYELGELLDGRMRFREIIVNEPEVTVLHGADGRTNLDPFFQPKSSASQPAAVELDRVQVEGALIQYVRELADNQKQVVRISQMDLNAEQVGNGKSKSRVHLESGWAQEWLQEGTVRDHLLGTLSFDAQMDLNAQWQPERLEPKGKLMVMNASERLVESKGLVADFSGAFAIGQLKQLALAFSRRPDEISRPVNLGSLRIAGPMDWSSGDASLEVAVLDVDQSVLNLLGQSQQLAFHQTRLSATNQLNVTGFGQSLQLQGKIKAAPLQVTHRRIKLPSLDSFSAHYDFTYQPKARHIAVHSFGLESNHQGDPFLYGTLKQPLTLSWDQGSVPNAPDSEIEFRIYPTDLADWQPWLGQYVREGELSGVLTAAVQQAGRHIDFGGSTKVEGMAVPYKDTTRPLGTGQFEWAGTISQLKALKFTRCRLTAGTPLQTYFSYEGTPQMDLQARTFSEPICKVTAHLPTLLQWFPVKAMDSSSGELVYNGAIHGGIKESSPIDWAGTLDWNDVTGRIQDRPVTHLEGSVQMNCVLNNRHALEIQRLELDAQLDDKPLMAKLDLKGQWDFRTGHLTLNQAGLQQGDLALMQALVPWKGVHSGMVNANLKVDHKPGESTRIQGGMALAKGHVGHWPQWIYAQAGELDTTLHWQKDGSVRGDVRSVQVKAFDPSQPDQVTGRLSAAGAVDSAKGEWKFTLAPSILSHTLLAPLVNRTNWLAPATLQAGELSNPKPLQLQWNTKGDVAVNGPLNLSGIRLADPAGRLPRETLGAQVNVHLSSKKHATGRSWKSPANSNRAVFTVAGQPAGGVDWSVDYAATNRMGQFLFEVTGVDHRIFQLVPEPLRGGVKLKSGRVDKLTAQCQIDEGEYQFDASVKLNQVHLTERTGLWPNVPVDLVQELRGSWRPGDQLHLEVDRNQGTVKQGAEELGSYDLAAKITKGGYEWNLKSLSLGPAFTRRAMDYWLPGHPVNAGWLKLDKIDINLPQQGVGEVKGRFTAKGFTLPAPEANGRLQSLDTQLEIQAAGTNKVLQIQNFNLALPSTANAANRIKIGGTLNLKDLLAPSANLRLASDVVDITPLIALLQKKEQPEVGESAAENPAAKRKFALKDFRVNLDLKRLVWRDLMATNLTGNVVMDGAKYTFDPLQFHLLGAPSMLEGQVQSVNGQTQMALNINVEQLPLDPVIRHFAPNHKIQWGKLTATGFLQVLGWSGESFRNSFIVRGIEPKSPAHLKIKGAHWGFKKGGFLVGIIAEVLRLPELLDSHFNSAKLTLTVQSGTAKFEELAAGGPLLRLGIKEGVGQLGEQFLDTTVKKQDLSIELAPQLAEEFRPIGILFPQEGFKEMPTFLSLEGTIRKPIVKVDKPIVLGQILALGISGRPGSLLREFNPLKGKPDGEGKELKLNPIDILRFIVPGGE